MKRKKPKHFASNALCDRTVTFLPVLFEVTTAVCNLVGEEKKMQGCERKREEGSVEGGVKTTSHTKPHTSATTVAPHGHDQPQLHPDRTGPTRKLD